jgi:hypothetical protein
MRTSVKRWLGETSMVINGTVKISATWRLARRERSSATSSGYQAKERFSFFTAPWEAYCLTIRWARFRCPFYSTGNGQRAVGAALTAGDFNGDGKSDLVAGIPSRVVSGISAAGSIFVVEFVGVGLDG